MIAEDYDMFHKCFFAAMWNRLGVPAPGDFSSDIKPKVELRLIIFPAFSLLVEADGSDVCPPARTGASWVASRARGILSIAAKTFIIHILYSIRAFSVVVTASMIFVGVSAAAENQSDSSGHRSHHRFRVWVRGCSVGRTPPLAFHTGVIGELAVRRDLRHVFKGVGHMHFFHLGG